MSAQVLATFNLFKACSVQQITHGASLIVTVFKHQPAAGIEVLRGLRDDFTQIVKAIGTGHQRAFRLEAHIAFSQMNVAGGYIRRVADDQVKALICQRAEPVTGEYTDVFKQ